jgi:hypothetical protein
VSDWKTLSSQEVEDILKGGNQREVYKYVGHSFKPLKGVGKQYCTRCGLLALNTPITQWCVDKGCNYEDHKQYKSKLKTLTKMEW